MNELLEKELELKLSKRIKEIGGWPAKFVSPGMAGVPDRILLLPGGKMLFVEMKKPGQILRPLQEKRKRDLEKLGFIVQVVDSAYKIEALCTAIERGDLFD